MTYDVAVIGLGGMGSAIASACVRRGYATLGIEQFGPANDRGSSHGKTRIVRQAYFEHDSYVPLLLEAYRLWEELERESGRNLLEKTGVLLVGSPDDPILSRSLESARRHALDVEPLSARDIASHFPMTQPRDNEAGVLERAGGVVFPELTVSTYIERATKDGADLRFRAAMHGWERRGGRIAVRFGDGETAEARRLVLALGAWFANESLDAVPVHIQRNVQVWFEPRGRGFGPGVCPSFLVSRPDAAAVFYGMPDFGGGVKAAFHKYGSIVRDPSAFSRSTGDDDVVELRSALNDWMPGSAGRVLAADPCMYSLTPDEHFAIGFPRGVDDVIVAGGFSGHGFKFVPVVGEIVADLVAAGVTNHEIGFLSPDRFLSP